MSRIPRTQITSDFSISKILTGLWQVADMERAGPIDIARAADAMLPYVEAGFTTFDMADHYGSAEEIVGAFRTRYPDQPVELLTKWVPTPGPVTRADVRAAVERALDRMQMERLDLLQFHAWVYADPSWLDGLFYLQELQHEGLIRHLGLTNTDTVHLRMAQRCGIEIVTNQVCYSLLDRRASTDMAAWCAEGGAKILAFGTLAGGLLTERWRGHAAPDVEAMDTWSQMKYGRYVEAAGGWDRFQALLEAVHRVADRHGASMANVVSRFILDDPAVGGVIIGARLGERSHHEDNAAMFDLDLTGGDREDIGKALADLDPIPGDCGDEYRRPPFLTASGDLSHHVDVFPSPYPTEERASGRTHAFSGTVWEDLAGFSRAVRHGNRIFVSGTTATHGDRLIGEDDPETQMHFVIDKVEGAIKALGGTLEDVVRTTIYINDADDWESVSRAHGKRFARIQPANTLVQAGLIGDGYRVEMEAEAVV